MLGHFLQEYQQTKYIVSTKQFSFGKIVSRILILRGNATKPVNINKDETEGRMKIHSHFR
jgi:hypothetical protein